MANQPPDERPSIRIKAFRNRPLDENLVNLINGKSGEELRKRIYVVFVNEFGLEEAGIDARGCVFFVSEGGVHSLTLPEIYRLTHARTQHRLFKEFITSVASSIFDPSLGLFVVRDVGELKSVDDVITSQ